MLPYHDHDRDRFSSKRMEKKTSWQQLEDTDAPPMVEQDDQRKPVEETCKGGEDNDRESWGTKICSADSCGMDSG